MNWLRSLIPLPMALLMASASGPGWSAGANAAIEAFAAHCFSPFLTAVTAQERLSIPGARIDFYDIDPFSDVAPSPSDDVAKGTDRRCAVAIDGNVADQAAAAVVDTLSREGITDQAPLPEGYMPLPGTAILAARFLNPNRVAVVHIGTRAGPNGTETFMFVERQVREDR